jgi:hypothetical protein
MASPDQSSPRLRFGLEAVSKPAHDNNHAGQLNKAEVKIRVSLVSGDEATEVLEPGDGTFDPPTFLETVEFSPVLERRSTSVAAMATDQIDATLLQSVSTDITIEGLVVKQAFHGASQDATID